jgi:hypothetical protein
MPNSRKMVVLPYVMRVDRWLAWSQAEPSRSVRQDDVSLYVQEVSLGVQAVMCAVIDLGYA